MELKKCIIDNKLLEKSNWPQSWNKRPYFELKDKFFKLCLENLS